MAKTIAQLKADTKRKKKYLSYFKKEKAKGKLPEKYGTYTKKRRKSNARTRNVSDQLRAAGISYKDIDKLRD